MFQLGKFIIFMNAENNGRIRGRGGEALHYLIFKTISDYNRIYADKIHQEENKPFTISPIIIASPDKQIRVKDGFTIIEKNNTYCFYVNALDKDFLNIFKESVEHKLSENKYILLNKIIFEIIDIHTEGLTDYSEIYKNEFDYNIISMDIISPLTFRHKGINLPLPLPELVLSSALNIWNHFSKINIPDVIISKDNIPICIGRYELKTELINFSQYTLYGCRGYVEYNLKKETDDKYKNYIRALFSLSGYSGIGYKRSMGMGFVHTKFK